MKRSASFSLLWRTGSTRITFVPFRFASRRMGCRWTFETAAFFPQRITFRALPTSKMSCISSAPKSITCAVSPAPEQMSPRLTVTGPKSSKK